MIYVWTQNDVRTLHRRGWEFIAWGIVMVGVGVALAVVPQLTGQILATILGLAVVAGGLALVYGGFRLGEVSRGLEAATIVLGLLFAAAGAAIIVYAAAVTRFVLVIVAIIAVLAGAWDLVSGIAIAGTFDWWWLRALRGALLIALGIWVLATPVSGLVALGWLAGLAAIALGALSIAFGVGALRAA